MRIVVVPERLRSLSSQLQLTARELGALSGRVGSALGGLDWETRRKAGVDGWVGDARGRANALAGQAETMAQYLSRKAQAFWDTDQVGAAIVLGVATAWKSWEVSYRAAIPDMDNVRDSSWWRQIDQSGWHTRFSELGRLKAEIERNDSVAAPSLERIRDLQIRIEELEVQRAKLQKHASNPLNQIIPELPLRADKDGTPWRVLADSDEDRIVQLDAEIKRLLNLKHMHVQYYLLDDRIKQGIPQDGPSEPKALYGCTYYAATKRNVDTWDAWGNGAVWGNNARDAGWETGRMPVKGALVSFQPGTSYYDEGKGYDVQLDTTYGHVAYVEDIDWSRSDVVRIKLSEGNNTGVVGPGDVREGFWVTLDKKGVKRGDATFIYGPEPLPPEQQMYMA